MLAEICDFNTQKNTGTCLAKQDQAGSYVRYSGIMMNILTKECDFETATDVYYKKIPNPAVTKYCRFEDQTHVILSGNHQPYLLQRN